MTGQRDSIEVLRDCISILKDIEHVPLTMKAKKAIEAYVEETMDAILRPLYPKETAER